MIPVSQVLFLSESLYHTTPTYQSTEPEHHGMVGFTCQVFLLLSWKLIPQMNTFHMLTHSHETHPIGLV